MSASVNFRFHGRKWSIFRRSDANSGGHFYIHVQRHGKRYKRSLHTGDAELAIAIAKQFIAEIERGIVLKQLVANGRATLGQVFEVYGRLATLQPTTVRRNIYSMKFIIRQARGTAAELFPLDSLDDSVVRDFQTKYVNRMLGRVSEDYSRREARERALRATRSHIRMARSLFAASRGWIETYAAHGIQIPECVRSFMTCKLAGRSICSNYNPPPDSVVKRTIQAFSKPAGDKPIDMDVYLCFWFALGAGLRRRELAALRWEHIVERDGQPWVSGGIGKDGEQIEVPIQLACWEAIKPYRRQTGRVMQLSFQRWAAKVSAIMKGLGWKTRKHLHELRAYTGSLIYSVSPVSAMRFLRHKSISTTEHFYVRYHCGVKVPQVLPLPGTSGASS